MIDSDAVVELLNEMHKHDPEAAAALVQARVRCNAALAGHPTVQVGTTDDGGFEVGLLGVLNGLLGEAGERLVAARYDDTTGALVGFGLHHPDRLEA